MKPVLLVLAAGMGSRYGGLKQLAPVGEHGQLIIDYSLYDAKRAGFEDVVFVIRPEMEQAFSETISARIGDKMNISYAHQVLSDLPEGFSVPEGRTKPWGTGHAALAARHLVKGGFAIINADDFYGKTAFQQVYDHLATAKEGEFALVGYELQNTVTEHGTVSRGVCAVDGQEKLVNIVERTHIEKGETCPRFSLDKGESWEDLPGDSIVSMNLWGFDGSYLKDAQRQFQSFLDKMPDPLTSEFYLPSVADEMVSQGNATVSVLPCGDLWYGITYPDDRPLVVDALAKMCQAGEYPANLWE